MFHTPRSAAARCFAAALLTGTALVAACPAWAQVSSRWDGSVDTDWGNPDNWNPDTVPSLIANITDSTATNQPTIAADDIFATRQVNVGAAGGTAPVLMVNGVLELGDAGANGFLGIATGGTGSIDEVGTVIVSGVIRAAATAGSDPGLNVATVSGGDGALRIQNGGSGSFATLCVACGFASSTGLVEVAGAGSTLDLTSTAAGIRIGNINAGGGVGHLRILGGGEVIAAGGVGGTLGIGSSIEVRGADGSGNASHFEIGTSIDMRGDVTVADGGHFELTGTSGLSRFSDTASLTLSGGGRLDIASASGLSVSQQANMLITGLGTEFNLAGTLSINANNVGAPTADFVIEDGAVVNVTASGPSGLALGVERKLIVNDATLNMTGGLLMNRGNLLSSNAKLNFGIGTLQMGNVSDGNTLTLINSDITAGQILSGFSANVINLGGTASGPAGAVGAFDVGDLRLNNGDFVINHNATDYNIAGTISSGGTNGIIRHVAGDTIFSGVSTGNFFNGQTRVSGGTLRVNGVFGGTTHEMTVFNGATLGGSGTIGGTVAILDGHLAPGASPGTLSIDGDLLLGSAAILDFELGSPTGTPGIDSDFIDVSGDLTLDGTLNVVDAGGFGAGLYRLISFSGDITDNGLELGSIPGGFSVSDLSIQVTDTNDGNVNLLVAAQATPLTFWDGGNFTDNGVVDGGAGIWTATGTNWTSDTGAPNSFYDPTQLLIFMGAGGAVTLDDNAGPIAVEQGMQFAADGYVLSGSDLVLDGNGATIRVGDGTLAGAEFTATIASNITGGAALEKTDLGTLVLTGTNSYTGGTLITNGALIGNTTSLQGDIVNNAVLEFSQFSLGSFAGNISGSGAVVKGGSGTLVLTGTNSYTGGTSVIGGGFLQGDSRSLQGNIDLSSSQLIFDQAFDDSYAGNVSGNGSLTKAGIGVLTLTGASSFAGSTIVEQGVLVAAAANLPDSASLAIESGATMRFVQEEDATFAQTISGDGIFVKAGSGALTLTQTVGDSDFNFTGAASIEAGTLFLNGNGFGGTIGVGDGARLGGFGSTGIVTVNSGGTVAPGNSIGTLSVTGLTFAAGSTYIVELDDGGNVAGVNNDLIASSGPVVIDGGTVHVTPENGADNGRTYTPGTTYTIVTGRRASGDDGAITAAAVGDGVDGAFDAVTDDFAFLDFLLSYDSENVFLTSQLARTTFCIDGSTFNQCSTGEGAFSLGGGALFDALLNLSNAEAPAALDRLSGEIHASMNTALVEDSRFAREAVLARLNAAGEGAGAWGQVFGNWGHWNSDGNAGRIDRDISGFFTGIDAPLGENARGGVMAGYSHSEFVIPSRGSAGSADSWHLGVYAGGQWGGLGVKLGGAYAWHDMKAARDIAFTGFADRTDASYAARTGQIFAEAAYRIETGQAVLEPFANLAWVRATADGYAETGGAAALSGGSASHDATFGTLGVRGEIGVGGALHLTGSAGWRHAFGSHVDRLPFTTHAFAGSDNFTIVGVPIARDLFALDLGAGLKLSERANLSVTYNGQFGSALSDQGVKASLSIRF